MYTVMTTQTIIHDSPPPHPSVDTDVVAALTLMWSQRWHWCCRSVDTDVVAVLTLLCKIIHFLRGIFTKHYKNESILWFLIVGLPTECRDLKERPILRIHCCVTPPNNVTASLFLFSYADFVDIISNHHPYVLCSVQFYLVGTCL